MLENNKNGIKKWGKDKKELLRETLVSKYGRGCCWCGRLLGLAEELTIEHLLSRCRGGDDHEDNLALACKPCNNNRETRLRHQYRKNREYIAWVEHEERWEIKYQLTYTEQSIDTNQNSANVDPSIRNKYGNHSSY